jgi:sigma-B regulation protein RsbU (phosphoserine phosphatase)
VPSSDSSPTEDFADLYENAPCGYVSLSPDGRIVKVNRTLADWLGVTADQLIARSAHELLSFGGRIAYETHLAPLLRLQGFVHEIALDLVHADGSKIPVIANAAERRGPQGEHLFTRLTLFKAVDRRTYERSLIEARVKAESAAKAEQETAMLREQFIAVLGHDLRNPVAALAAGVRLLEDREALSERGQMLTREMNASIARASALIDNVLDFARGRLGEGLTLSRDRDAPVKAVLEQVVAEARLIDPDRKIRADLAIDQPVDCDPARIGQLAANLISNAVTHGAPGIPIEVEARTRDASFIFSVANGGVPIAPAARERLFQPFFRGAVRRSQQGLGLGLFIVSEIAKAHGGTIEVSSTEEETRFTFAMPTASN